MTITFGDINNVDPIENFEASGTNTITGQLTVDGNIIINPINGFHLQLFSTTEPGGFYLIKNINEQQGLFYISNFNEKDMVFDASSSVTNMGVSFLTNGNPRLRLGNNGEIAINNSNGNAGEVLTSNGTNAAHWAVPPGATYTNGSNININGTTINVISHPNFAGSVSTQTYFGVHNSYIDFSPNDGCNFVVYTSNGATTGNLRFYAIVSYPSDDRVKHYEKDVSNGLEIIRQLKTQRYTKTPKITNDPVEIAKTGITEVGFIAQEVKKIPDLSYAVNGGGTTTDASGNVKEELYALNYNAIFAYNVSATKELDAIVQKQAQLISSLEARIKALEIK